MIAGDKMAVYERCRYIRKMKTCYRRADHKVPGRLLEQLARIRRSTVERRLACLPRRRPRTANSVLCNVSMGRIGARSL